MKALKLKIGTAVSTVSAAFLLGGCGPSVYDQLDSGVSTIFTDFNRCVGEFCTKSYAAAATKRLSLAYGSQSDCASFHGDVCTPFQHYVDTSIITYYIAPNGVMTPQITPSGHDETSWAPPLIGWQALDANPEIAVPVFPMQQPGVGMRGDGRVLQLTP